jgi:UDP-galactopyranose mutase
LTVSIVRDVHGASLCEAPLICFSHLRWDFVHQRPQHLMERFSRTRPVFFVEEYIPTDHHLPYLEYHPFEGTEVVAVRPRVPHWWNEGDRERALAGLMDLLVKLNRVHDPVLWFYTPMMLPFARHLKASAVVYDCMDELANFRFAPPHLRELEAELMERADIVFTGGYSLYEAKRDRHANIHPFPSSVDVAHFKRARSGLAPAGDLAGIPGKRLGFYGVIDERMDLGLLKAVAERRPDWSLVMVGPLAKIGPDDLPRLPNIHFLGQRAYADLPSYLAGWDVALMPFAVNETTRFISPTKTPEYLAAGKPVVSTPIPDVMRHYGGLEGVRIADTPDAFVAACEAAIALGQHKQSWLPQVDVRLAGMSWDETQAQMATLIEAAQFRRSGVGEIEALARLTERRLSDTPAQERV